MATNNNTLPQPGGQGPPPGGQTPPPFQHGVPLPPLLAGTPPPQPPAYVLTHYNGTLPAATGKVATILAAPPLAEQRKDASDLYTFLADPATDL